MDQIGYARVSTTDQDLQLQLQKLQTEPAIEFSDKFWNGAQLQVAIE